MKIESFKKTLTNGLRIVCIPQSHLHACEVSCYIGVGSRYEVPEVSGVSHFLEHMLFRGTVDYPSSLDLEKAFEALGGGANAATDAETTCYFSRFHPAEVSAGLALFASMLQRPLLRDIEIERRIILEEAQEDFNEQGVEINPDSLMARQLWPDTLLAQPTIGSLKVLASLDVEQLRQHHQQFYRPDNTVIAVAGNIEPNEVFAAAEKYFQGWARSGEQVAPEPVAEQKLCSGTTWVKDSASQLTIQIAFPLPGRSSEHSLNLRILRRLLSGGVTSRLMLRLRETLGLTYNIEANLTMLAETGALVVDLMVTPENICQAVEEVLQVFRELRDESIPQDEFSRIIRNYQYDLDFSHDHPDEMVTRYGWGELVGFVREIEADHKGVLALTAAALTETARQCLDPQQVQLVVVGPWQQPERQRVESALANFSAIVS